MTNMDETDQNLLMLLRSHARMPLSELSRKLGLARSTVQARLERLENKDIIAGYGVRFGAAYEARQIHATILARLAPNVTTTVLSELRKISEVVSASTTSGRFDLVIELEVAELQRLDEIIDSLEAIEGFEDSESLVHLSRRINRQI